MAVFTKSRARRAQERVDAPLAAGATVRATPASRYAALATDHKNTAFFEASDTIGVDGSDSASRNLSPFILQVNPPFIYGSSPTVGNPAKVGMYEAALRGQNSFGSARRNVQALGFAQQGSQALLTQYQLTGTGSSENRVSNLEGSQDVGRLGRPQIADVQQAVSMARQLNTLVNTPPLVLLINPETLSIQENKLLNFQDRTRYGYVMQAWGEEQTRLSIDLKCGAFMSGGRGMQRASRADSASWQNMESLFRFYQNNGYLYDVLGESHAHLMIGVISIHYDQRVWYGHFENMSWADSEENQNGGVTFSMEFVVSREVDTAPAITTVTPYQSPNASLFDGYSFQEPLSEAVVQPPDTEFVSRGRRGIETGVGVPSTGAQRQEAVLVETPSAPIVAPEVNTLRLIRPRISFVN